MALHIARSYHELISEARKAEENEAFDTAADLYLKAIRQDPFMELPYNRLMIIYRKQKKYEKEFQIINRAIEKFEAFYQSRSARLLEKNKTATRLSTALAKSLGGGKKGQNPLPQPIPKWLKRKETVEKKLGR